MVASAGLNLVESSLKGTVTQMNEDMSNSPETPKCGRSKVDIKC